MNIADWMLCDYWTPKEAALLLSGINPDGASCRADFSLEQGDLFAGPVPCLDGQILDVAPPSTPGVINEITIRYMEQVQAANEIILEKRRVLSASVIRVMSLIERSPLMPKAPPRTVIEWALSKSLDIPEELGSGVKAYPRSRNSQETPEMRRQRLSARIQEEKAKGTRAYLKVVAQGEGISISRLKQLTAQKTDTSRKWSGLTASSSQSSSKKSKSRI